jgi:hypothetical protein
MTQLFVGGLSFATTDLELADAFSAWGWVDSSAVLRDRETGRSQGFGFVGMPNPLEATIAISRVNGTSIGGREVSVSEERPPPSSAPAAPADLLEYLRAAERIALPDAELLDAAKVVRVDRDLLAQIAADPTALWRISPRQFEELVCELLYRSGFDAVRLTPESKDGGVDICAIRQTASGASLFVVECKRWIPPHHVGLGIVQRLYGVMHYSRASAGLVANTSRFTRPAQEWRAEVADELVLRDFDGITDWLRACVAGSMVVPD